MTAIAEARDILRKEGEVQSFPVQAAVQIFKGTPSIVDTDGYLQTNDGTTTSLANGDIFAGISYEGADNTSGVAGDENCRAFQKGSFLLEFSDVLTQANVGDLVYVNNVTDDSVVTVTSDSGNPQLTIGQIVEFVDASNAYVLIDNYVGNVAANGA